MRAILYRLRVWIAIRILGLGPLNLLVVKLRPMMVPGTWYKFQFWISCDGESEPSFTVDGTR